LDPHYIDLALRRFAETYGVNAVETNSDMDFDQLRREREEPRPQGEIKNTDRKRSDAPRRGK
jgi:hypothetical protein